MTTNSLITDRIPNSADHAMQFQITKVTNLQKILEDFLVKCETNSEYLLKNIFEIHKSFIDCSNEIARLQISNQIYSEINYRRQKLKNNFHVGLDLHFDRARLHEMEINFCSFINNAKEKKKTSEIDAYKMEQILQDDDLISDDKSCMNVSSATSVNLEQLNSKIDNHSQKTETSLFEEANFVENHKDSNRDFSETQDTKNDSISEPITTYTYSQNMAIMLELNRSSYHYLGVAEPFSYVQKSKSDEDPNKFKLPWLQRRRSNEYEEIHKDAINSVMNLMEDLSKRIFKAAEQCGSSYVTGNAKIIEKKPIPVFSSKEKTPDLRFQTSHLKSISKEFEPLPLLIPPKLPATKLDKCTVFPQLPTFSDAINSNEIVVNRLVRQGNLYEATKRHKKEPNNRRSLKEINTSRLELNNEQSKTSSSITKSSKSVEKKNQSQQYVEDDEESGHNFFNFVKKIKLQKDTFQREFSTILSKKTNVSLKRLSTNNSLKSSKSASMVEKHSILDSARTGLSKSSSLATKSVHNLKGHGKNQYCDIELVEEMKKDRVKTLTEIHLSSPRVLDRINAARSLGQLKYDSSQLRITVVAHLLNLINQQEIIKSQMPEEILLQAEAIKALLLLGIWSDDVLENLNRLLVDSHSSFRILLLEAICLAKDVTFVKKSLPNFKVLMNLLIDISSMKGNDEMASYLAAKCLGRLCVYDENAKERLLVYLEKHKDAKKFALIPHQMIEQVIDTCDILVRQMNCKKNPLVLDMLLNRIRASPSWQTRLESGKIMLYLDKDLLTKEENWGEKFNQILENRIYDDHKLEVRKISAEVIRHFNLYSRFCDRAVKKLSSNNEDIRSQGVISIGSLNIRNENVIKVLLEMVELDTSDFVRIQIIRTFAVLKLNDKRVLECLREKDKPEISMALEARKALQTIIS